MPHSSSWNIPETSVHKEWTTSFFSLEYKKSTKIIGTHYDSKEYFAMKAGNKLMVDQ
jgi:hypothetical protein